MTAGLPRSRARRDRTHSPPQSRIRAAFARGFHDDCGFRGIFMTPTPKLASGAVARAGAGVPAGRGVAANAATQGSPAESFVLNLCSSTTPMALEQTQLPELKRFTFFVSRRLEEGRERFRLHMGYFATLAEAEDWLNVVRDIYPGAWAGEAPGKKLRERAVAAAAAQVKHAVGPQVQVAAATQAAAPNAKSRPIAPGQRPPAVAASAQTVTRAVASVANEMASRMSQQAPPAPTRGAVPPNVTVPTLHAAAPAVRSPVQPVTRSTPAASASLNAAPTSKAPAQNARVATPAARQPAPTVRQSAPPLARTVPAVPNSAMPATASAPSPARTAMPATPGPARAVARPPAGPAVTAKGAPKAAPKATIPTSNVREVLAALDESTGETRMMPAPVMANPDRSAEATLTDTQVLRFLEVRRDDAADRADEEGASGSISLLKPDDTGTRRALKEAVVQNAPVSFAVQLQWSVQPVELDKVPPLAIFSAYTLYTVEGSRDGRKWYGLRLGFFTDAISAKQVAYYVRSEFASVAVVPVSPQERSRASEDDRKASGLAFPRKTRQEPVDEFKLIDSEAEPLPIPAQASKPRATVKPAAGGKATSNANASAAGRRGGRVRAREQRSPQTLEETLEILGASQLEIDNGSGETLNDSGVRHLRVEVQKNTPFRRLIDRLTERARKD